MKGKIRRLLAMVLAVMMTVSMVSTDALASGFYSEPAETPYSDSTTYAASSVTIAVGKTKYDIEYTNTNAWYQNYLSDNESVAKVDTTSGAVTGVSGGSATITHQWKNGFFDGWTEETIDVEVIDDSTTKYQVNWYINGELDKTTLVSEGEQPVYGGTPAYTRAAGTEFLGWATETVTSKNVSYTAEADLPAVTSDVSYYAVFEAETYFYFVLPGKSSTSEKETDYMYAGKGKIIVPDGQSGRWYSNSHSIGDYISTPPSDAAIRQGLSTYYDGSNGRDLYEDNWTYTIDWAALSVAAGSVGYDYISLSGTNDFHIDTSITIDKSNEATIMYIVSKPDTSINQSTIHPKNTIVEINSTVTDTGTIKTDGYDYSRTIYYNGVTYTFDGWYTDRTYTTKAPDSITITGSEHYYARYITEPVTLTYDANGGTFADGKTANKEVQAQRGQLTTLITPPTRAGYEFAGWTRSDGRADLSATATTFTMPDGDLTLTAKWTPLEATYTVEHYRENLDGTYSRVDIEEGLVGQIGEEVTATAKTTYTGFTKTNHSDSMESGVVREDGSLVLKVYYARNLYTVTTSVTNGTITPTNSAVKFEDDATVEYTPNPGYVLESITVDGNVLTEEEMNAASSSYTFEAVKADHSIGVVYVRDTSEFSINNIEESYDGQTYSLTFDGVTRGSEEKQYSLDNGLNWQAEAPQWTDATVSEDNPEGITVQVRVVDEERIIWSDETSVIIRPRPVTLTSATDSKTYDGKPLTNGEVTVGGEGFVDGQGADYTVKGSQLDKGTSKNTFAYTLKDGTKEENYAITKTEGDLIVNAISTPITVKAGSDSKTYDGSALTKDGYESNAESVLVRGDKLEVVISGTQTDAGSSENVVTKVKVVRGEADVTANYTFGTHQSGTLTVNKRPVTLTSGNGNKVYDGKPLTNGEVTVGGKGFADGEGATYNVTGKQLDAGNSKNEFTYTLNEGTKADNYEIKKVEGDLVVRQSEEEIVITAESAEKVYDGTPIANSHSTYKGTLVEGDELLVTVQGEAKEGENLTDVGTYANKVVSYRVMRGDTEVTKNYKFGDSVDGILTVTKRPVTLTSGSAEREYNGQPLTNDVVTPSTGENAGFVDGEGLKGYETTGSQLGEGTSKNEFTYELKDNTKADNYEITKVEGDLKVTKVAAAITITADSNSKMYDGTALTDDGYTYTPDVLKGDDVLTAVVEGSITDYSEAGEANVVRSYKVMNGTTDVTGSYTFNQSVNGTLTITKRPVTLTSATDSKTYDGKPLTNGEVTVGGEGFVDGQGADYTVKGSQLDKGTSKNTFAYTLKDGTKEENYAITKTEGDLTVNAISKPITVTANSDSRAYNGEPLTAQSVKYTNGILKDGDKLIPTVVGSQKDAGESKNVVTGVRVVRESDGKDVTDNYTFGDFEEGKLTVTKAPLTLASADNEKVYDGTPLFNDGKEVTATGWVTGEGATYEFTASQRLVGSTKNTFEFKEMLGDTKAENYEIVWKPGTLTVTDGTEEDPVDPGDVVTKTHEEGTYGFGDTITFTIEVTNIYNDIKTVTIQELPNVTIVGENSKEAEPGETVTFTATYTVTRADLVAGSFTNTVRASFSGGKTFENDDEVTELDTTTYTLRIQYQTADGTTLAPDSVGTYYVGESFYVTSPDVAGYTPNYAYLSGNMPNRDLTLPVIYTAIPGTPTPTDPTTPTPPTTPPTPPVTVVPTPDGPATIPAPVLIGEEEVPLGGEVTVDDDGNVTVVPVEDEEVPLARDIDDHDCCALHFLLTLAAFIIYLFFTKSMKKRQAKINELRDQYETEVLKRKLGIADNDKDRTV